MFKIGDLVTTQQDIAILGTGVTLYKVVYVDNELRKFDIIHYGYSDVNRIIAIPKTDEIENVAEHIYREINMDGMHLFGTTIKTIKRNLPAWF